MSGVILAVSGPALLSKSAALPIALGALAGRTVAARGPGVLGSRSHRVGTQRLPALDCGDVLEPYPVGYHYG